MVRKGLSVGKQWESLAAVESQLVERLIAVRQARAGTSSSTSPRPPVRPPVCLSHHHYQSHLSILIQQNKRKPSCGLTLFCMHVVDLEIPIAMEQEAEVVEDVLSVYCSSKSKASLLQCGCLVPPKMTKVEQTATNALLRCNEACSKSKQTEKSICQVMPHS